MAKGLKIALIVVLVVAVLGGGVAGIISLVDSDKFDTKNISDLSFGVGGLDSAGKYMSTDQSIYTKDAFECQGLNVSLEFDSEISYQIYFYDQNNDFVHTTGKLEGAFVADSIPFFAKYARIVITPDDDEKVTSLEVLKYAKQLNAKVNREQGFKNYTENLLDFKYKDKVIGSTGELEDAAGTSFPDSDASEFVNIAPYDECLYFKDAPNSSWAHGCVFYFYDSEKNYISKSKVIDLAICDFTSSEGIRYLQVLTKDLPENTKFFRMFWQSGSPYPEIYCR